MLVTFASLQWKYLTDKLNSRLLHSLDALPIIELNIKLIEASAVEAVHFTVDRKQGEGMPVIVGFLYFPFNP